MAKKETAEEKLLKIIEATKKAKGGASSGAESSALVKTSKSKLFISVRQLNAVLIAAVLAGFLFLIYEVQSGVSSLNEDVSISVDAVTPKENVNILVPQMKSVAYYLDRIVARNIFQPYDKKAVEQGAAGQVGIQAKMSKYKLVGVAWLDVPESATVMIEDVARKETRFLREGDKIEDVKVKTIYTDRVVFSYANEEITIKL